MTQAEDTSKARAKQDEVIDAAVRGEIGSDEVDAPDLNGDLAEEIPEEINDVTHAQKYARDSHRHFGGVKYEDIDHNLLRAGWENLDSAGMNWDEAQSAVRDAYIELEDNLEIGSGEEGEYEADKA